MAPARLKKMLGFADGTSTVPPLTPGEMIQAGAPVGYANPSPISFGAPQLGNILPPAFYRDASALGGALAGVFSGPAGRPSPGWRGAPAPTSGMPLPSGVGAAPYGGPVTPAPGAPAFAARTTFQPTAAEVPADLSAASATPYQLAVQAAHDTAQSELRGGAGFNLPPNPMQFPVAPAAPNGIRWERPGEIAPPQAPAGPMTVIRGGVPTVSGGSPSLHQQQAAAQIAATQPAPARAAMDLYHAANNAWLQQAQEALKAAGGDETNPQYLATRARLDNEHATRLQAIMAGQQFDMLQLMNSGAMAVNPFANSAAYGYPSLTQ